MLDEYYHTGPGIQHSTTKIAVASFFAMALLFLILALYSAKQSFPELSKGSYGGRIFSISALGNEAPIVFRVDENARVLLVFTDSEVLSSNLPNFPDEGRFSSLLSSRRTPLFVNIGDTRLKFIGSDSGDGLAHGTVVDTHTKQRGRWELAKLVKKESDTGTSTWLSLLQELQNLKGSIVNLRQSEAQRALDIEKLETFLADGKKLKNNADRKFQEESVLVAATKKKFEATLAGNELLRSKLTLVERVSPLGRLVNLSRQTFDREAQWFFLNVDRSVEPSEEVVR